MPETLSDLLRDVRIRRIARRRHLEVAPETPLSEVYRLLDEGRPGAVLVVQDGRAVGIFTERDLVERCALEEPDLETPVQRVMTTDPASLPPDARVAEAIQLMIDGGYRHVPLVRPDGRSAGVLTSRDILRFLADRFPEAVLNLPPRLHQTMATPEGG